MKKTIITFSVAVLALLGLYFLEKAFRTKEDPVTVGIAWRADTDSEFFTNIVRGVEACGAKVVILPQVKADGFDYEDGLLAARYCDSLGILLPSYADSIKQNTYRGVPVEEFMAGVDAVIFTGGEDIVPTLFREPQPWHGIAEEWDYNVTRDISDYLLMAWCIDHDYPTLGLCRGAQMLGVVSGAAIIQDIPAFMASQGRNYQYEHRNNVPAGQYRDYASHDVFVSDTASLLYSITGTTLIQNVPSWHHQAVGSVEGTPLKVTGITTVGDYDFAEAVERTDKSFVLGLQYHPEAALVKNLTGAGNASDYMSREEAEKYFKALIHASQVHPGL